jgi:hypothetical protein
MVLAKMSHWQDLFGLGARLVGYNRTVDSNRDAPLTPSLPAA